MSRIGKAPVKVPAGATVRFTVESGRMRLLVPAPAPAAPAGEAPAAPAAEDAP